MQQAAYHFLAKWVQPIIPLKRVFNAAAAYRDYLTDWSRYSKMPGAEATSFLTSHPALFDRTETTAFDAHYFYQDIWVFERIRASEIPFHLDVGSRAIFVGMLSTITRVFFLDIRPLPVSLDNFSPLSGSALALPFADNSVSSLSCLHVAEHIGLGRYGDPLDPKGTEKATQELSRVLAPGGNLYFSLPVGKSRLCFNAHRIHTPQQILDYFHDLSLVQFGGVDDNNLFKPQMAPGLLASSDFACGFFHFTKM